MKLKNQNLKVKIKGMVRGELIAVLVILLVVAAVAGVQFRQAEVKGRDIQRKNDLKHIRAALSDYFKDVGAYPKGENGAILACGQGFDVCRWGRDAVVNPEDGKKYINPLPEDPLPGDFVYVYFSNTRSFQLLAHLERRDDVEYNESVEKRGIMCREGLCNFGIASGDSVPLKQDLPTYSEEEPR